MGFFLFGSPPRRARTPWTTHNGRKAVGVPRQFSRWNDLRPQLHLPGAEKGLGPPRLRPGVVSFRAGSGTQLEEVSSIRGRQSSRDRKDVLFAKFDFHFDTDKKAEQKPLRFHHTLGDVLRKGALDMPVVTLIGPRQSGKTTMVREESTLRFGGGSPSPPGSPSDQYAADSKTVVQPEGGTFFADLIVPGGPGFQNPPGLL